MIMTKCSWLMMKLSCFHQKHMDGWYWAYCYNTNNDDDMFDVKVINEMVQERFGTNEGNKVRQERGASKICWQNNQKCCSSYCWILCCYKSKFIVNYHCDVTSFVLAKGTKNIIVVLINNEKVCMDQRIKTRDGWVSGIYIFTDMTCNTLEMMHAQSTQNTYVNANTLHELLKYPFKAMMRDTATEMNDT